jgi:DNA polymerase III delta subunit
MRLTAARALERIQKGTVVPAYMLIGAELYWRDQIVQALRNALDIDPESFGLSEFDLRQDSLDKVFEKAQSQSLLSPRQLILIRNAQNIQSRRGKESDTSSEATEAASPSRTSATAAAKSGGMAAYLADPNPAATLVFEMSDVDLDSDDWREKEKAKSRVEAYEGVMDVVLLLSPGFDEAVNLVHREFATRGQKISPPAAEQLVAAFHQNMALIRMEIEKLYLRQPEKGRIDVQDLNDLVSPAAGETSLGLGDAIGARDPGAVLEILDAIKRSGRYAPLVLSEVARYLRQLILLKEAKPRDARQAAKVLWDSKLGAPQSAIPTLVEQSRRFKAAELMRGLKLAFDTDMALRSSPPDEGLVLEKFLLELVGRTDAKQMGGV